MRFASSVALSRVKLPVITQLSLSIFGNRRIRDDLVIHHDVQNVGAVRAGSNGAGRLSELLLALGGELHLNVVLIGHAVRRVAVAVGTPFDVRAGQPLLAVGIEEGQLSGGAQGLNCFLRVGDLRDLNRYAVLAAEGYGSLGKEPLVGQTLTNDLLYRVHVVGQVVGVVAVRDFGLVYDTGAADQIQTQTDTVVGIEYARDDGLQTGVFFVSAESVEAESAEVLADASVLSAVLSALSALLSVDEGTARIRRRRADVAVFRNGMVQPPGMYTPVTAVTPKKMMISMTAIKGSYTFSLASASFNFLLHN